MQRDFFKYLPVVAAVLAMTSCTHEMIAERDSQPNAEYAYEADAVQGKVRIRVTEDLAERFESMADETGTVRMIGVKSSDDVLSSINVTSIRRLFPDGGKFESRRREAGLHLWYEVEYDNSVPVTRAKSQLVTMDGVTFVEQAPKLSRDYKIVDVEDIPDYGRAAEQPTQDELYFNDPKMYWQWHYYNNGWFKGSVAGCDINVMPAWKQGDVGSSDVIVSIVDGGIDVTHEDLISNLWINTAERDGQPGVDDDGNGYVDDIYGFNFVRNVGTVTPDDHGTHVAGTVAAVNNNNVGVAGVAGGDYKNGIPGARLMSCQMFEGEDQGMGERAIIYGADNGAVISQNSWGYITYAPPTQTIKDAIDYFVENAGYDENGVQVGPMAGGLVVFAAGNNNESKGAPAEYESAVAVTSVAADFERAYYSNYGGWTDIAATGGDEYKGDPGRRQVVYSTVPGGYTGMQGTSMACPHVSGVAALMVSKYGGPGFTPEKLKQILFETANSDAIYGSGRNANYQNKLGVGLVDAFAALSMGSDIAPEKVTGFTAATKHSNVVEVSWTVPKDEDNGQPTHYNVYYSENPIDASLDRQNLPDNVYSVKVRNGIHKPGETLVSDIELSGFEKTFYLAVDASDYSRNLSELSEVLTVTTGKNSSPVTDPADKLEIEVGASKTVESIVKISDPDGHRLTWSLKDKEQNGVSAAPNPANAAEVKITVAGPSVAAGTELLNNALIVTDAYGLSFELPIEIRIVPNNPPKLIKEFEDITLLPNKNNVTLSLSDYFSDPDGDAISYTFSSEDPSLLKITYDQEKNEVKIQALLYGSTTVKVTAKDVLGAVTEAEFKVTMSDGGSSSDNALNCYPNPAKDFVKVSVSSDVSGVLYLYSVSGAKVLTQEVDIKADTPYELDVKSVPSGVYTLVVKDKVTGKEYKQNIVKL